MKKSLISTAVVAVLGCSAPAASAAVATYNWNGLFTFLDSSGAALANTSNTTNGANQFQTAITGTMSFDTVTGAGTATMAPFNFFAGTIPAEAVGINMQAIGDGAGGPGSLVLGNMLFNWSGTDGMPISLVLDAAGFFGATAGMWGDGTLDQADVVGHGAVPASDGTYLNSTFGYLNTGPVPMATTEWNTSLAPGCLIGNCMVVSPSGALPLVTDTATNGNEFAMGDGVGVGGNPMQDGPFQGFSPNFDITKLTATGFDANATIAPFCDFDPSGNLCGTGTVPIPAALWLFGSGLLGLIGIARKKAA